MLRALSHALAGPSGRTTAGVVQQLAQVIPTSSVPAAAAAAGDSSSTSSSSGVSVAGSVNAFAANEFACWQAKRWATKRQGGSTKNKADSHTKHLGTKMSDGQVAFPGQIIVRQRGLRLKPGAGVGVSVDQSLFAKAVGIIRFTRHIEKIAGRPARGVRRVSVVPLRSDYGPGYAARAQAMVEARNEHRKRLLGLRAKFG